MPDLMSAALFERDDRVLAAHRRRAPFAGQWMLPVTVVRDDEAAEDALRRHAREQFGVGVDAEAFVETVYLTDAGDKHQYVANIFRARLADGPMRFNAEGDYDDARWLAAADLEQLAMPPDLQAPLVKLLTDPDALKQIDWGEIDEATGRASAIAADAVPIAEREGAAAPAPIGPPPDNRAGWDAIATAYQEERFGDRFGTRLMWSWRASEEDLRVLGDVGGLHAIVLGCGGGQDVVALAEMGAIVVGVDQSTKQLEYARKYATRRNAVNVSFVEADVSDLSRFDDESFDVAVSIHVLNHVERADRAIAEAARLLKPGGTMAVAVQHPFDVCVDGGPPYVIHDPYWIRSRNWRWDFKDGSSGAFRAYYRTFGEWLDLLISAGFTLERIVEPDESRLPKPDGDEHDDAWLALMPYTLVLKARKR
jgi:SAM-dependent methyltransferase/ADP-ribose pyrophosphatase YjhB (NUDIX family)